MKNIFFLFVLTIGSCRSIDQVGSSSLTSDDYYTKRNAEHLLAFPTSDEDQLYQRDANGKIIHQEGLNDLQLVDTTSANSTTLKRMKKFPDNRSRENRSINIVG